MGEMKLVSALSFPWVGKAEKAFKSLDHDANNAIRF